MPKFEVRLESQTDSQARIVSLDAVDAAAARSVAEAQELSIVNFSLLPPERDVWECPPGGPESSDGLVDLSRWDAYDTQWAAHAATLPYDGAVSAAKARLSELTNRIDIGPTGKVRGSSLRGRAQARVLAHRQSEPYAVSEVREVSDAEVDARRLVAMVRKLASQNDPRYDPLKWQRIIDALGDQGIPLNVVTAAIHGVAILAHDTGATPIVWGTGTGGNDIYVALLTAYTANVDTHNAWDDVSATQVTGTGYTANGVELAGKAVSYDTATDTTRLDADDASWTTSTISATDAAIVNRTPATDATREVYGSVDFGATVSTTAGTFQITWDATGIVVRDYT